VARVEVRRHIAADPASVALLLAEPMGEDAGRDGVTVALPRRGGVGFIASIEVEDIDGRVSHGTVSVKPSSDPGTDLVVSVAAPEGPAARSVERAARLFLSRLAVRARSRSFAA